MNKNKDAIAYFSLEIALDEKLKTYAGGLGVLAGDILRSAADAGFPMIGLSLLNRCGYLRQKISASGIQTTVPEHRLNYSLLTEEKKRVVVSLGKDKVVLRMWRYEVVGATGESIPVYLLDSNLPENKASLRSLTDRLYTSDKAQRLRQEIILGRGGVKALSVLGYKKINKYHLNEGHGSLAALELFLNSKNRSLAGKIKEARARCVFTVHTPLPSAQDTFDWDFFFKHQNDWPTELNFLVESGKINLTKVGLYFGGYINAVSLRHGEVSRQMFPGFKIDSITNGVNAPFWVTKEMRGLYDKYLPNWSNNYKIFAKADCIPSTEIALAHAGAKRRLLSLIKKSTGQGLREDLFTIVFARRFTAYKRPELIFKDVDRLLALSRKFGSLQIIFAGKAHESDENGQALIKFVWDMKKRLAGKVEIVFLSNYGLKEAKLLVSGADLWLNTPLPPFEASATSGMKAAQNGVPQLSTFDGWWREGYVRGKTGWTILENKKSGQNNLYDLLEKDILPLYYQRTSAWPELMRSTIKFNAAVFNTARVLEEYNRRAYKLKNW